MNAEQSSPDRSDPSAAQSAASSVTSAARSRIGRAVVLAGFVLLVFCTGTAEYLVSGVLPQLAADVSVSIAAAGQIVTAYALGVAIGGPVVTALTARLPRKGLALALGAVFIAGTAITVIAPSYAWVIAGRVASACSQATLFAVGLTTATGLMGQARQGRAIAIVGSGLTIATVLGVPMGALLGGSTNWRMPFVIVAAVAALGVLLLATAMERTPAPTTGVGDEIRTLLRAPVLLAVATTTIGFAGVGLVFTYLAPLLSEVTGIAAGTIPGLLLAYGIGGFIGNLVAGRLADLSVRATLVGVLLALILTLAVFPLLAPRPAPMIGAVLILGLLSTATIAPLQSLVLHHAGAAPTLSLAVNVGAFNLANAIGAALGGLGAAAGLLRWSGFGGALLAAAGLGLAAAALRMDREAR